jgi:formylglycine-generating enzyme
MSYRKLLLVLLLILIAFGQTWAVAPRETTNSIEMKLMLIPAGEFQMGNHKSAEELFDAFKNFTAEKFGPEAFKAEYPLHRVRITKPFFLGTHQVTRGQFRKFVQDTGYRTDAEKPGNVGEGYDPATGKFENKASYNWDNVGFDQTDEHPVVNVSWNDATAFCKWLSQKEGKAYRLPTEAEWEYACRAGTTTHYWFGDDPEKLTEYANGPDAAYKAKFPDKTGTLRGNDGYVFTSPVGRYRPNPLGLYGLHGNVWEWCADWGRHDYYGVSPLEDPAGPETGEARVLRGGCWRDSLWEARSSARHAFPPTFHMLCVGFRVAM